MLANEMIASIKNSQSIAVLPHVNMDGDAFGSSMGLYLSLKKLGKDVALIVEEEPQDMFKFLPDIGEIYLFKGKNIELENRIFDMVLSLDTGDFERLGNRGKVFQNAKTTGNIDHHPTNTNFAKFNQVVSTASATGEIIYQLLKDMEVEFDENIATCLYTAIASDTGGFRFSNTSALTHTIAADLISLGALASVVCTNLFENSSLERLRIMGEIINRLEIHGNGKISLITLPQSVIDELKASEEDVGGFSNMGRTIRGVEVAVFIRERDSQNVKVSMRARDKVDVSALATKFGGGGHKRAAGFEFKGTLQECKDILLKELLELV